ncbi:hypothetical protein K501DRAFT_257791 [Backusella circina FSU 941]|nr:hypothetical protein K501DRAFT_257791 [Backusella circina FSU 941]
MDGNITIHVRSPSLQETLEIKIAQNAFITVLKQEIQRVHPQHPLPEDQRIIYSGKLLDNENQIETLLKKSEDNVIPTFHLVVKPSNSSSSSSSSSSSRPTPTLDNINQPTMPDIQPQPQPQPQTEPQVQQTNALPQYPPLLPGGYQVVALNGQYYLAPVLVPSVQPIQTQPVYQNVPNSRFENIPAMGHTQQPNAPAYPPQFEQQQQPQPQQPQQQQRQLQPQAILRNIAGFLRPAANGQLAGNIWLALKLYLMIFILSQGASLERILLFHAIALVLFLYQTGRLRIVVHRRQQPQAVPTTAFEVIKRGIYMFFLSLWPSFNNQDQQRTE